MMTRLKKILNKIEQIENERVLMFFALFFLLVAPGLLAVFLFHKDIFLGIDLFKLLLLAIALITPLFLINFVICFKFCWGFPLEEDVNVHETVFFTSIVALFLINLIFYLLISASYFFDFPFISFFLIVVATETILAVPYVIFFK